MQPVSPSKAIIHALRQENKTFGTAFVQISSLPPQSANEAKNMKEVEWVCAWRNRYFLAQVFLEKGCTRITINRTDVDKNGRWKDGITWDELQSIKNQIGFMDKIAIEIFPPESRVVNVSNMRHLWIIENQASLPLW